jgi:UDP-N-acetylmuramate--alanine ligase
MTFNYNNIHILGIGGAGMNGIANILLEMGKNITGGDKSDNETIEYFRNKNIKIYSDDDLHALENCDLIIATSAVKEDHIIRQEAKRRNITFWTRHDLLPVLLQDRFVIAVAGTHGKTTTTSMVRHILRENNIDCGYLVGVPDVSNSGHLGSSKIFVIEADEYAKTFLCLKPNISIINNIDWDHPDIYPTQEEYIAAFRQFAINTADNKGLIIANTDNEIAKQALIDLPTKEFGFNTSLFKTTAENVNYDSQGIKYDIISSDESLGQVFVPAFGNHNVLNSLAAILATSSFILQDIDSDNSSQIVQLNEDQAVSALKSFGKVARRCELKGISKDGTYFYDDYAHTPAEIATTINGIKNAFPDKKVIAIWQPHSFNRVITYEKDFIESCKISDIMVICPIYGARDGGSYDFASFKTELDNKKTFYIDKLTTDFSEIIALVKKILFSSDGKHIVITLNASNLYKIHDSLVHEIDSL